jgi:hypothetical protein
MENVETQPDPPEINLQERALETPSDNSLPAAQVLTDQMDNSENNHAARFIP